MVDATSPAALKNALAERSRAEGFEVMRVTHADAIPQAAGRLRHFLAENRHGEMDWMARHEARRASPRGLWPQAESVIMLGMNYGAQATPECDPHSDLLAALAQETSGLIAVYAQRRDYHNVIKKKLRRLARWLAQEGAGEVKLFVDTAPVMEKPLAEAAGLGWQGKHTNLVSRELGSFLFLAALYTDLPLPPDAPEIDHCGSCSACLDACPTAAFPTPYQLDARRCISYLTIEYKGVIAPEFRAAMGNRIYGCDDCIAVCPWNKFAQAAQEAKLAMQADLHLPSLVELAALDDAAFRQRFAGLPIKRTGRDRFVRNVLIALGNISNPAPAHIAAVMARLDDEAALVRGMAVWALARLAPDRVQPLAERYFADETDAHVRAEWQAVLHG
jgi:epoxyqueuosine reductase